MIKNIKAFVFIFMFSLFFVGCGKEEVIETPSEVVPNPLDDILITTPLTVSLEKENVIINDNKNNTEKTEIITSEKEENISTEKEEDIEDEIIHFDDYDDKLANQIKKFKPITLSEASDYVIKDSYIKKTFDAPYASDSFGNIELITLSNEDSEDEKYLVYTSEEVASFICDTSYYIINELAYRGRIECVLEYAEDVLYYDKPYSLYKLVNVRYILSNGKIIDSFEKEDIVEALIEDEKRVEKENKEKIYEEDLMVTDIFAHGRRITCVDKEGNEKEIRYDEEIADVYFLEIGETYTFGYRITNEFFKSYDLASTPVKTSDLGLDLYDFREKDTSIPIDKMPKDFGVSSEDVVYKHNDENLIFLDYCSAYYDYEDLNWIVRRDRNSLYYDKYGEFEIPINKSLGELIYLVDNCYSLGLIVENDKVVNARFIDNLELMDSMKYEDIVNKLEKDRLVTVKDCEEVFEVTYFQYGTLYAVDEDGERKSFDFFNDLPMWKLKEEERYKFNYRIIERLYSYDEPIYLLDSFEMIE